MAGDYVGEDTAATTAGGYMLNRYLGKTNCLTHIPQDINLTLDPLNVIGVGSPTVNNGVVSGFSASNYLTLPKVFNPSSNTWEIVLKVKMGSSVSDRRGLMGASNGKDYQCFSLVIEHNKLYLYISSNGTSWDIASKIGGNTTFSSGTYYYIKLAFTGSAYAVSYSESGSTWNTEVSVSSTAKVHASANPLALGYLKYKPDSTQYFHGSIDLKESYIKINGSSWWKAGTGNLTLKKGSKVYIPNGWTDYKYYKYTYENWTMPVLTENGTVGGDSYAARASSNYSEHDPFKAFNGTLSNSDDCWEASTRTLTDWIEFYSPVKLKISDITFKNRGGKYFTSYSVIKLTASNDGVNYTTISEFNIGSRAAGASWQKTFSVNEGYKYFRFSAGEGATYVGNSTAKVSFGEITFNAKEVTGSVESTSSDYDYKVGSGSMVFDEVVVASDISTTDIYNRKIALFLNNTGFKTWALSECYSGSNAPTSGDVYKKWYDTTANVIKTTDNGGNTWFAENDSLPIAIATSNTVGITSIDQILQWCGYIGSHAFVLPGVKGLIPNGLNENGTCKSIESNITSVQIIETPKDESYYIILGNNDGLISPNIAGYDYAVRKNNSSDQSGFKYDSTTNKYTGIGSSNLNKQLYFTIVGSFKRENGKITSLTPATVKTTNDYSRHLLNYNGTRYILRR